MSSNSPSAPEQSLWVRINPLHAAVFGLVAVTLFRLWFSTRMELVPDEAYYWLWAKHPALSYRDKGPGIAWTIALGTRLFGETVFGIRFFGVLLSAGTAWQLFSLARRLFDARTGLWCLIVALVIPLFAVGAILMTIDSLSVFFWAWGANLFWTALEKGKMRHWIGLGLVMGCGFLAKFTNGVQLICIAMFLLWSKEHRRLFISRQTVAMVAAFCVSILPIIYWNYQVGWIHVAALQSRSGAKNSFNVHPGELLRFLEEQAGVISPLLLGGLVVAAVGLFWKSRQDLRVRFLLCQFVPLYAIFIFFSLNKAGKANWPAPALVTGVVMLVVFWKNLTARKPAWRWAVAAALAMAALMTILLHNTDPLNLPAKLEPLRRAQGWPDFAQHIDRIRKQEGINLLIGGHYSVASMMQFYLPDRPPTYLQPEAYGKSQFGLWPGYEVRPETRALLVTESKGPVPDVLLKQFSSAKLIDDFWSQHDGRPMTRYKVYLLTNQ